MDWYKRPSAAYYGAKKACTPLHILYAHDDQSVHVVNSYYEARTALRACYVLYNLDGTKVVEETLDVSVEADGRTRVAGITPPEGMSDPWFLRLELRDSNETTLSVNTYWLSHTPDIPGRNGHDENRLFFVVFKSVADFTALRNLTDVALEARAARVEQAGETRYAVNIVNPTPHIAFMAEVALMDPDTGLEAAPVYWDDNYLILLPGETRTLQAVAPALVPAVKQLRIQGFNITPDVHAIKQS